MTHLRTVAASLALSFAAALLAGPAVAQVAGGPPATAIHEAVRSGNIAAVEALLHKTPGLITAKDETGQTPLHVAARGTSTAMLALLVRRGADVNMPDNGGNVPLHIVAGRGDTAGITLLLDNHADVNVNNVQAAYIATPLHAAVMGSRVDALKLLAGRGANLESRETRGRTPLVMAAREMRGAAVVGALLDLGANVNAADKSDDTALTLAAWRGSADVVSLLLARGAAIPIDGPKGRQLLEFATSTGLADLFARMIDKDADVTFDIGHQRTLLHSAAEGGSVPVIAALLGKQLAINGADANGWTPLHFATDMGRVEAMTFLLGKGANVNARTSLGQSPFNIAEENADAPLTALLGARGADKTPPLFPDLRGPYMGQKPPGQTPEIFAPGIVSARYGMHSDVVFSPDGTEAFWSLSIPPRGSDYGSGRTVVSRLVDGRWTYPKPAIFDGIALGDVPFFHPAGDRLYDVSARAMPDGEPAGKENIWVWQRAASGWGRPQPVDSSVNRLRQHWQISVDQVGTLFFSSSWRGASGIFASRLVDGRYADPEPLAAAIGSDASFPFIAPDGSYLLFTRNFVDISVSFRDARGAWGEAVSLGPELRGMLPIVSPDGKYLFFSRDQRAYWVDAGIIERLRPR